MVLYDRVPVLGRYWFSFGGSVLFSSTDTRPRFVALFPSPHNHRHSTHLSLFELTLYATLGAVCYKRIGMKFMETRLSCEVGWLYRKYKAESGEKPAQSPPVVKMMGGEIKAML